MARRFKNSLWLALRDYLGEWQISGFAILSLAAVLGPMLILFGLKFGVVGNMIDKLIQNPANLEIRSITPGRYTPEWLDNLQQQPGVRFVLPEYPDITGTVKLQSEQAGRIVQAGLKATAVGDPVLIDIQAPAMGEVVLSSRLADKLKVAQGGEINANISRFFQGKNERVAIPLKVIFILPKNSDIQRGGLVALQLIEAIADFREGKAVPAMDWDGSSEPVNRVYTGFRIYADSVHAVQPLQQALTQAGVESRSRSHDIEIVTAIDRNLSTVYWLVAAIGLIGYTLSLGANLWANIDRKRRDLAVLRVVGFKTGDIVWLPVLQAIFTAILGWGLACGMYWLVALLINRGMSSQLEPGQTICQLLPVHFGAALALTIFAAVVSSTLAGLRASRVEPSQALREL